MPVLGPENSSNCTYVSDRNGCSDSWPPLPTNPPSNRTTSGRTKSGIFSDSVVETCYLNRCETHQVLLREAPGQLTRAAHDNQPLPVPLVFHKSVVIFAHRLVTVGHATGSGVDSRTRAGESWLPANRYLSFLQRTLRATLAAAVFMESGSSDAVREMADNADARQGGLRAGRELVNSANDA